ncbi:unnamed protein product [Oppiella nova]|uniref:Cytochrome P450 n=1 Tax=Oppiella nova TaxID=334625 RepID=A0A7R9LJN9_9ACAR|nr:unnamed protein product [Oppiella nova]CAG2164302.1 unnamed protein product [Oppiella nova]
MSGFSFFSSLNNSLINDLTNQLPPRASDRAIHECSLLKTDNSTLSALVPGWEGIPTAIIMNFCLGLLILFGFGALRRRSIVKEKQYTKEVKTHMNTDFLQFIYDNKKSSESEYFTDKQINRNHPKAYLPLVLHSYDHLIPDRVQEKPEESNIELFTTTVGSPPLDAEDNQKDEKNNKSKLNIENLDKTGNLPTLRSRSARNALNSRPTTPTDSTQPQEQQLSLLKTVLQANDTDSVISLSIGPQKDRESPKPTDNTTKTLTEWIIKYLLIKDKDILQKRGVDALQYLLFQRYLLYLMVCLTIICLLIILPINLYGNRLDGFEDVAYKKTTMLNIRYTSPLIWVHAFMTLMVVFMGIYLMENYSMIISQRVINIDKKILIIENIPNSQRNPRSLTDFFKTKFPNTYIVRIVFVYDISKVLELMKSLLTTIEAKKYCAHYLQIYGQRCEVRPYTLGNLLGILGCCYHFPKVDGIEFYTKEKQELEDSINKELEICVSTPQRMAFVVFSDKSEAKEQWLCGHKSDSMNSWLWQVSYAPFPDDIEWTDISAARSRLMISDFLLNVLIVVVFLFLSTPYSVIHLLKSMPALNETIEEVPHLTKSNDKVVKNGPFFINYVLTAATLGNALELTRIPELISYLICIILMSRSPAEYLRARQLTRFEFHFGTYYPRVLLVFTLVVTFSISNPLIAPVGLFYMFFKNLVDRYLIYHVYIPSKINYKMHAKAILFVKISYVFLLLQVYINLNGRDNPWPYLTRNFNYWSKRGINGPKPLIGFGNVLSQFITPRPLFELQWYKKYGKLYGTYIGNEPVINVADPELIKTILVKDFHLFPERHPDRGLHPILEKNLVDVTGDDWKRLRSLASPTFSSGKMKKMYPMIKSCLEEFLSELNTYAKEGREANMKELYGNYTMDVIATCAFATKTNAHKDPNNPFIKNAKVIFSVKVAKMVAVLVLPKPVLRKMGIQSFFDESANDFFFNLTRHVIKQRKNSNKKYNDFIDLLLNAEKSNNEVIHDENDAHESHHVNEGEEELEIQNNTLNGIKKYITEDEILAQAWIFFQAGYETTATTLTFATYELALNEDIQQKLYEEVLSAVDAKGDIDYDLLSKLPFLDAVISETLRLHSPVLRLSRNCINGDYKLGNTGITLYKNQRVEIPTFAIHLSEEYYPNAEKFIPDRFLPENRHKIVPYTYLPFGAGPRNCIGMRFALMEAKLGLAQVLRRFKIVRTSQTDVPLKFNKTLFLNSAKRVIVGIEARN